MAKRILGLGLVMVLLLVSVSWATPQVIPRMISFSGRLVDEQGNPVTTPTDISFTFWNSESGGTQLDPWSESHRVTPTGRVISLIMGSQTMIPTTIFANDQVYLEVQVAGGTPVRARMVAAPFAFRAAIADSLSVPVTLQAAASDPLIQVINTEEKGIAIRAEGGPKAAAVEGYNDKTEGIGVQGRVSQTSGIGVKGVGGMIGVYGGGEYMGVSGRSQYAGVAGEGTGPLGSGVYGQATDPSGTGYGVWGKTESSNGYGGHFEGGKGIKITGNQAGIEFPDGTVLTSAVAGGVSAPLSLQTSTADPVIKGDNTGDGPGIQGISGGMQGIGVSGTASQGIGVSGSGGAVGISGSGGSVGVSGRATGSQGKGIYGETTAADGYAGYFEGKVEVTGDLTANKFIGDGSGLTGVAGGVSAPLSLQASITEAVIEGSNTSTGPGVSGSGGSRGVYGAARGDLGAGIYGSAAGDPGYGVYGTATASDAVNFGGFFVASGKNGYGVLGTALHDTGTNYGVYGETKSPNGYAGYFVGGRGVKVMDGDLEIVNGKFIGDASGLTGVAGGVLAPLSLQASIAEPVIQGSNAASGTGIKGHSTSGTGVYGSSGVFTLPAGPGATSPTGHGVIGEVEKSDKAGVYGKNLGAGHGVYGTSSDGYGVYGEGADAGVYGGNLDIGPGVYGRNTSTGPGLFGLSAGGEGLWGVGGDEKIGVVGLTGDTNSISTYPSNGAGVYGESGSGYGGVFRSADGHGLQGKSTHGAGLYATSTNYHGVAAFSVSSGENARAGVYGYNEAVSSGGPGVYGLSKSGHGVYGKTDNVSKAGVYGESSADRYGCLAGSAYGVYGRNKTGTAVEGSSDDSMGVRGESKSLYGVYGQSQSSVGVYGNSYSGTKAGVYAKNSEGGPALELGEGNIKVEAEIIRIPDPDNEVTINKIAGYVTFLPNSNHIAVHNSYFKTDSIVLVTVQHNYNYDGLNASIFHRQTGVFGISLSQTTSSPIEVGFLIIN